MRSAQKNTAAEQLPSVAASCGIHESKVVQNGAQKRRGYGPLIPGLCAFMQLLRVQSVRHQSCTSCLVRRCRPSVHILYERAGSVNTVLFFRFRGSGDESRERRRSFFVKFSGRTRPKRKRKAPGFGGSRRRFVCLVLKRS